MDTPTDRVVPHLKHAPERSGRRGADWWLGLEKRANDATDSKWASTNVEFLTADELVALRDEINRKLLAARGGLSGTRIDTRQALVELARKLRVRPDWHEPDEQEVTALVHGDSFDNAGFWGHYDGELDTFGDDRQEMWVELFQDGKPVAEINLATLLAFATGYEG